MISNRRAHTTLPATDIARAKRFYADKLGLQPVTESEGGIFYEVAEGTRFVLYPTPNPSRAGHTQIGFTTTDLEEEVAELRARGVVFEEYDFPGLKTVGGIATTGTARAAWFKDSEGNTIGLVQLPPGAEPGS